MKVLNLYFIFKLYCIIYSSLCYLNNPYLIISISLIVQETILKRLFEMNGENRRSEFQHIHFQHILYILIYFYIFM